MDIDKQLGAITAEFWHQIGSNNNQNNEIILPPNTCVQEEKELNFPRIVQSSNNTFGQLDDQHNNILFQFPVINIGQDSVNALNHEMKLESQIEQEENLIIPNVIVSNDLILSNYQQTLGELIEETLLKTNKNNASPTKIPRVRKNSSRSSQNSSQIAANNSSRQISSIISNGKDSNIRNSDAQSTIEWFDTQEKQQTLDREEKAIQRKKANNKNKKWTPQELQRLYDLLECFGTDFTTIQQYFEKKTVTQIKNKFHKEEKDDPEKIKRLLFCKGSNKRLSIKLENERDFQTIQKYYNDKYLHSNLNQIQTNFDSFSNSSTPPLSLSSPSSQENAIALQPTSLFNQQALIQGIPACINLPSESLKIVADDIERRLLKERSNTQ